MIKGRLLHREKRGKPKEIDPSANLTRRLGLPKRILCISIFAALSWNTGCTIARVSIPPPPSHIESIEGYASLRIRNEQGTARSKFSFLFRLPHQGRIDVSHIMGRTLYQIIIQEKGAFLIIPSKKVYWQGEEEEIIDRFLGFALNMEELVSLLSGQWDDKRTSDVEEHWREEWTIERDEEGRITKGYRGELGFEVIDYFKNTSVIRILVFRHPLSEGRLKILNLKFNKPLRKKAFSLDFLENYEQKTWQEIEEILNERRR